MEDVNDLAKKRDRSENHKTVGRFRLTYYPGGETAYSTVRAWDVGDYPQVCRKDPYPSWQLFEGDQEQALALFKMLENDDDIERLCDPTKRNPMLTRNEEIMAFKERYPDPPKRKR